MLQEDLVCLCCHAEHDLRRAYEENEGCSLTPRASKLSCGGQHKDNAAGQSMLTCWLAALTCKPLGGLRLPMPDTCLTSHLHITENRS